jgi:hypothetical protein
MPALNSKEFVTESFAHAPTSFFNLFRDLKVKTDPSTRKALNSKASTMTKRKADTLAQVPGANGRKKAKHDTSTEKIKPSLLEDSDSASSSDDDSVGGAKLEDGSFKINEEYAKRFEHNKKREELHKC